MKANGAWRFSSIPYSIFVVASLFLPGFALAQSQAVPPLSRPIVLEGRKSARLLLNQAKPEYPPAAQLNFIQGTVRVELLVASDGRVAHAHVVKGNAILAASALKAVRRSLYRPLLTPSGPSSFLTVVDVIFDRRLAASDPRPSEAERDLDRQIKPPEVAGQPADSSPDTSVRLRLLLDDRGQMIDSGPLPSSRGDLQAAYEEVQGWTFRPAHWGNVPIPSYLDVDVPVDGVTSLVARRSGGEAPK